MTSSEAARAISLLGFDRNLPTKTPARVAYSLRQLMSEKKMLKVTAEAEKKRGLYK
jgi:hypothetical protein